MALHVLLARQRSGTGALSSILDQHPDIKYLGELFHDDEIEREVSYFNFYKKKIREDANRGLPSTNEQNYQEYMSYVASLESKKNVFIDVKYNSTHHFNGVWHTPFGTPAFLQFCKNDNRKILHLKRRNFLKTYISGNLAEQNKIWHARENDNIEIKTISLEPNQLLEYLRLTAKQVMHFDFYLEKYPYLIELEYEDLFQKDGCLAEKTAKEIAKALEIDSTPFKTIKSFYFKQTSDDLSNVIENIDEVQKSLQKTEFSWMLPDKKSHWFWW